VDYGLHKLHNSVYTESNSVPQRLSINTNGAHTFRLGTALAKTTSMRMTSAVRPTMPAGPALDRRRLPRSLPAVSAPLLVMPAKQLLHSPLRRGQPAGDPVNRSFESAAHRAAADGDCQLSQPGRRRRASEAHVPDSDPDCFRCGTTDVRITLLSTAS
jgi:hypothetical protein